MLHLELQEPHLIFFFHVLMYLPNLPLISLLFTQFTYPNSTSTPDENQLSLFGLNYTFSSYRPIFHVQTLIFYKSLHQPNIPKWKSLSFFTSYKAPPICKPIQTVQSHHISTIQNCQSLPFMYEMKM